MRFIIHFSSKIYFITLSILLIILFLFFLNIGEVKAMVVSSSTILEYDLNEHVVITNSDITFDCNGHKIVGQGFGGYSGDSYAMVEMNNVKNVIVRNCIIENSWRGIFIGRSSNVSIEKNIFRTMHGVWLFFSDNIIVKDNILESPPEGLANTNRGINLEFSKNNLISKNTVNNFFLNIFVTGDKNQILENIIIGNPAGSVGINIDAPFFSGIRYGDENVVRGNDIRNHWNGVVIQRAFNSIIANNLIVDNRSRGISLTEDATANFIFGNTITRNFRGITLIGSSLHVPINNFIFHNNIFANSFFNATLENFSQPIEFSYQGEGNFWGHTSPLCFYRFGGSNIPYDSNAIDVIDSYPFCQKDSWLMPQSKQFWSQVQNSSVGWFNFRKTPGIKNLDGQDKPADDIIKTLPNGWVVKVSTTTDSIGVLIQLDGYQWYGVIDTTDDVGGWMAVKKLSDGIVYLPYDATAQTYFEQKATTTPYITKEARVPIILQAADTYYTTSTTNSLYSPAGGFDGNNNFQKFIQGANFLKEFVLAIAVEESGPSFNNEICSSVLDGGIGIMQITSLEFKGLGSGLYNKPKLNDCNKNTPGWIGNLSKYYSNTIQGIYTNIKDGFRVFQEKYRTQCYEETSGGLDFTCNDIRRILIIWGYNGFGDESRSYLNRIAAKLETLQNYFSGIVYSNADQFIQKLRQADRKKILALLGSPGELQIEDINRNITGVVGSIIQENIPNSLYEKDYKGIAIFFPKNPYIYRVIGTASGAYSLNVDYFNDDIKQSFRTTNIPIISGEIHEYYIDWDALLNGEAGITLQIDQNGDKIVDKTFISDETFEPEDIFLQSQTIIDFEPNTLNLESGGIATVYIELPIGYDVNDISTLSIRLNKVVHVLSKPIEAGDYDKDGKPDLMVKFAREEIKSTITTGEKVPIIIIGKVFYNGNYYYLKGQDVIKVISNKAESVPNPAVSRWALVQKIFDDLGKKIIVAFYGIVR